MTTYILHGGYTSLQNESNKTFYRELSKKVPDGGMVLLVYFATEGEEVAEKAEHDKENILSQSEGKALSFEIASENEFIQQIERADSIFIRGGFTSRLFATLEKFPEFKDAIEGKTVAGSSAGAYVLSTYFYSNSAGKVLNGFGCVPIRLACHYESDRHQTTGDPLGELDAYPNELELVALRDSEWRTFEV